MRWLPVLLGILLLCGLPLAHAHGPHILNYHTIGAGTLLTDSPTSDTLYAHVQHLLGHSYTFTTSRHFRTAIADNRSVALLAFDDGHESILTHALPDLTPASVRHELTHAATVLENLTGEPPAGLAYPYGLHDAPVREIAREHHECAFTTSTAAAHHNHDPHGIPRPPLHRGDDAALSRGARGNPVASTVIGLAMLTWPLPDASPINPAPAAWTPTTYRSLGDGRYTISAALTGIRHELSIREGP